MSDLKEETKNKLIKILFDKTKGLELNNKEFHNLFEDNGFDLRENIIYKKTNSKRRKVELFWRYESNAKVVEITKALLTKRNQQVKLKLSKKGVKKSEIKEEENKKKEIASIRRSLNSLAKKPDNPCKSDKSDDELLSDLKKKIQRAHNYKSQTDNVYNLAEHILQNICRNRGITFKEKTDIKDLFGKYNKYLHQTNKKISSEHPTSKLISQSKDFFNEAHRATRNLYSSTHPHAEKYEQYTEMEAKAMVQVGLIIIEFISNYDKEIHK